MPTKKSLQTPYTVSIQRGFLFEPPLILLFVRKEKQPAQSKMFLKSNVIIKVLFEFQLSKE